MPAVADAKPGADRGFSLGVGAIVAVAAVLRLAHAASLEKSPLADVLVGDARAYDAWARRIAAGDWIGSEVFYQAPLYPYVLGVVYALVGPSLGAVRVVQALLGAVSCGFLAQAGRVWISPSAGIVAGVLLALYAPAIFFDGLIQKSSLDLVFGTSLLWMLGEVRARESPGRLLGAGAVLGAFTLTRENALLLLPLVVLWLLVGPPVPARRRGMLRAALFVAGFALALAPVAVRNWTVSGEIVVTTMQSGTNLWFGNNPNATGRHEPLRAGREMPEFEREDATAIAEAAVGRKLGAGEVSAWWRDRALSWIRENPGAWLRLLAKKTLLVWNRVELPDTESLSFHADHSPVLRALGVVPAFGLLAPLAAAGGVLLRRRWRALWPLVGIAVVFTFAIALFYVLARYRYPLVPVLALLASGAIVEGIEAFRSRRKRDLALAGAGALLGAVVVWAPVAPTSDPRPLDWNNVGTSYADTGRYERALPWFERAAHAAPREPWVRYNLGKTLAALGRNPEAEAEIRAAVALDPAFARARVDLGALLAARGDLDGAAAEFEAALAAEPGSAFAWNNLGNVERIRGRPGEALRCYREAVSRDPTWAEARLNLAGLLADLGRMEEARAALRELLLREPGREDAAAFLRELEAGADPPR